MEFFCGLWGVFFLSFFFPSIDVLFQYEACLMDAAVIHLSYKSSDIQCLFTILPH